MSLRLAVLIIQRRIGEEMSKSITINDSTIEFQANAKDDKGKPIPAFVSFAPKTGANGKQYRQRLTGNWLVQNATNDDMDTMRKWFADHEKAEKAKQAKPANKGKAQGKAVKGLAGAVAKLENMDAIESIEWLNRQSDRAFVALATHYNGKKPHHKVGRNKLLTMLLEALTLDDTVDAIDGVAVLKVEPEEDLFADLDGDLFA